MAERQDWIEWDNSMKAHIDQIEVSWKHDITGAFKAQGDINELLADNVAELIREHKRTRHMIALCYILVALDFVLGIAAFDAYGLI